MWNARMSLMSRISVAANLQLPLDSLKRRIRRHHPTYVDVDCIPPSAAEIVAPRLNNIPIA
jgi:hypothetical protein